MKRCYLFSRYSTGWRKYNYYQIIRHFLIKEIIIFCHFDLRCLKTNENQTLVSKQIRLTHVYYPQ